MTERELELRRELARQLRAYAREQRLVTRAEWACWGLAATAVVAAVVWVMLS